MDVRSWRPTEPPVTVDKISDDHVRRWTRLVGDSMKNIFVSQNLVEVESLKERLDNAGIPCTIKNQQGSSLAGEVPFVEVFPELWVINDGDLEQAKELLEAWTSIDEAEQPKWVCSGCGENHVGRFTACWKCGKGKDSGSEIRSGLPAETETDNDRTPFSLIF